MAYEVFHFHKKKAKGNKNFFELKLDMGKVNDRLEWPFVAVTMRSFGFCKDWISLVMACVSTVNYIIGLR